MVPTNKKQHLGSFSGRPAASRSLSRALGMALALAAAASASAADLSHGLSGRKFDYIVQAGDSLTRLSSRYGVDRQTIAQMNGLDGNRLTIDRVLAIDNQHIIPSDAQRNGITINLPQRMLYYYRNGALVGAYPVAVGTPDWQTPMGKFRIVERKKDKPWIVPPSIQEEMRLQGLPVVKIIPPGPDDPLGKYWLRTSLPNIGIHGTNEPTSVYRFESHGCVRLNPADIQKLFSEVQPGTSGQVIYEPVLMAKADGGIYLEVDRDAYHKGGDPMAAVHELAKRNGLEDQIDWDKVKGVVQNQEGIAVNVALNSSGPGTAYAYEHAPAGSAPAAAQATSPAPVESTPASAHYQTPAVPQAPAYGPETYPEAQPYSYYAPGRL